MPLTLPDHSERAYLLDVSRLVWRLWRGRLPTGIDRVCLAYLEAFMAQSLAMLQWKDRRIVLSRRHSDALFRLLRGGVGTFRRRTVVALLMRAIPAALFRHRDLRGRIYLNVGHTGLDAGSLVSWLSYRGLEPVYLIHDLIPITHPRYCRPGEREKHEARLRNALRSAAGIIVNSAYTGRELARFARSEGYALPRMLAVPLGIEPVPASAAPPQPPRDHPYFVCIGTIEARKNHMVLLRAWAALREEKGGATPDLILIGQRGWEADDIFALLDAPAPPFGQVIEHGRCDDAQMACLLDHAQALLMPSFVEGFGLPVLEAMARKTPVIAADLPVFREIAGDIPCFVDPDDAAAWRDAVLRYGQDGPERERQVRRLGGYCPPTWAGHAAQVRVWLGTLPQRHARPGRPIASALAPEAESG